LKNQKIKSGKTRKSAVKTQDFASPKKTSTKKTSPKKPNAKSAKSNQPKAKGVQKKKIK
jgi:hypothetical protein